MTKDKAFEMLEEAVNQVATGDYENIEAAVVAAAQALNYTMDEIDNDNPSS
jgi:hypothetical protein